MTKVVKFWKRYNTWQTVIKVLTPIASGELIAFFAKFELPNWVHGIAGFIAVLLFYLKMFVKDENKDGIID